MRRSDTPSPSWDTRRMEKGAPSFSQVVEPPRAQLKEIDEEGNPGGVIWQSQ